MHHYAGQEWCSLEIYEEAFISIKDRCCHLLSHFHGFTPPLTEPASLQPFARRLTLSPTPHVRRLQLAPSARTHAAAQHSLSPSFAHSRPPLLAKNLELFVGSCSLAMEKIFEVEDLEDFGAMALFTIMLKLNNLLPC
ncbi:hypothetical protein PIB30_026780 [Stylosanthes scabra]|uniref:Uncharacterized protein n=1 Tax=Stylosanthes scabra TaxID=79078 RepID=A0ABU6Y997_9FABA|nr:hypothetical protein [Stylosanthes scabra]